MSRLTEVSKIQIISWIFGIGAMASLFAVYMQKSRKALLICKLSADICWVIHYLCLGAIGGAIPNFVGIFREAVFVNRRNGNWADNKIWPAVFILINLILGIITLFTKGTYINLLPICASAFVTVALYLKKPSLTKIMSFPVSSAFLIYDIFVLSYIGIINESLSLISITIAIIKMIKSKERI